MKSKSGEKSAPFDNFDNVITQLLSVSKEDLLEREREYKTETAKNPHKRGPKPRKAK